VRKVEEIEEQIRQLSPEEFAELRQWLLELDWKRWDARIEADTKAGKWTKLVSEAKTEYDACPGRRLLAGLLMVGAWSGPPIPAAVGMVVGLLLLAALLAGLAVFTANITLIRRLMPWAAGRSTVFHVCITGLAALPWLLMPVVVLSPSECEGCFLIWMAWALASPFVLVAQWRVLRRALSRIGAPG
jgi:hypothetical protein